MGVIKKYTFPCIRFLLVDPALKRNLKCDLKAPETTKMTSRTQLGSLDVHWSRMSVAAMTINALKLVLVLQQRVSIPLYSLSFPKKFSIRCRYLQVSRLNPAGKRQLDLSGMTASIRTSASALRNQFASNARFARFFPQNSLSMSAAMSRRSWA
jgi:hypothetical protein